MNERIRISVVNGLPKGFTIIGVTTIRDMDNHERKALVVSWYDRKCCDVRRANFCIETGEYLGENW